MRLQDELVALFKIADAKTRRYILGQVARLPVHFDAGELAALLDQGAGDAERAVSARAIAAWDRAGPTLIAHGYGLDPGRMGLWSTLAARAAGDAPAAADVSAPDADAQRAALAHVLAPCREPLLSLAARGDANGELARQVLGLVPLAGAEEVLIGGARDPARAIGSLLALRRRDPKLALATARDAGRPAWVRATVAGAAGGKAGLALAIEAARGDGDACWAAAEALPDFAGEAWLELARACLLSASGWGPVALADALGQLAPAPEALKLLDDLLKGARHDLVRIMAIKAMGGFPGDLAPRRAMKCLERGSPLLQAAAIECLARLDHRPPELAALLAQRAAAGPLKLRGTAILGLMVFDAKAALRHALELVRGSEPASRVEGAYVLGYLRSPTALEVLQVIAERDPFVPAALQAAKSLAHFPEEQAAPRLVTLLAHREPAVAHAALRVLGHYPGDAGAAVLPAIEALEKKSASAAAVLRDAGLLGAAVPGLTDYLARPRTDPVLRAAALEGLARSGEVPVELAKAAEATAPGALAQLVAGDESGATALAKQLEAAPTAALTALRDLAVIAGETGRGGRHARLARLLSRRGTGRSRALAAPIAKAPPRPEPARPAPVAAKSDTETRKVADELSGVLDRLEPAAQARPDWPRQLTYLHGPASFFETYRALLPAVAIVGALALVFVGQTLRHALWPEASAVVVRDNLLGKVGTPVEISGKITATTPERNTLVVLKDRKVPVKIWMPGYAVNTLKVGAEVTVNGTVKDLRSEPPVVHGFTLKE